MSDNAEKKLREFTEVRYLGPARTLHVPRDMDPKRRAAFEQLINQIEGAQWIAWMDDPLAQLTVQLPSVAPTEHAKRYRRHRRPR